MNKTVTINLGGIIFHIEEDAYETLSKYLNTIKGYFRDSDGRDEIMTDIESRIAEMLSAKVSKDKQAVLMSDVNEVIAVMGRPEDFAGEHHQEQKKEETGPQTAATGKRRIFRDPDHKILGGVCSGIGAYFGFDPLWLRLAWVLSVFVFGTGILLYIILWIIIPQAKTTAEKLEMTGEPVTAQNIGKKVEEEMGSFKKTMEDLGDEAKKTFSKENAKKAETFFDKVFEFFSMVFGAFFRAFARFIGVFLVIIGLILLANIISSAFFGTNIIHFSSTGLSLRDLFDAFFANRQQIAAATVGLSLLLGIPLLMLVYGGFKIMLGIKKQNRMLNIVSTSLWLVGVAVCVIVGVQAGNAFSEKGTQKERVFLHKPKTDTLYLEAQSERNISEDENGSELELTFRKRNLITVDGKNVYFGYPELDVVKSDNDSIELVITRSARGEERKAATRTAEGIACGWSQKDSLVQFDSYFSVPREEKWRDQRVRFELRIPKNKVVFLSKSTRNMLSDVHNTTDTYDRDMPGHYWMMDNDELSCLDCPLPDMKHAHKTKKEKNEEQY